MNAYNFPKTLKDLIPYEFILKISKNAREMLTINPLHHALGLEI